MPPHYGGGSAEPAEVLLTSFVLPELVGLPVVFPYWKNVNGALHCKFLFNFHAGLKLELQNLVLYPLAAL